MCGRYATTSSTPELIAEFDVGESLLDSDRLSYNVAPTQEVPAILDRRPRSADVEAVRMLRPVRWGLIPSWAKDAKIGSRMINARSETLTEKPSFKAAAARRRCILPAAGFYEWQVANDGKKQPYFLHDPEQPILAFAGLYELWPDPTVEDDDHKWVWSCTVITRPASDSSGHIHERTPVVVPVELRTDWLDCTSGRGSDARHLLDQMPQPRLVPYRVSTAVNNVRNNGPELLEPMG